jgi:shikimate dehydrogenase
MRKFGLIGYPLGHSFSKKYFSEKFQSESITDCSYENYPLANINQVSGLVENEPELCGFNVTIPYKSEIIPFLSAIDDEAKEIGAVNVVKILRQGGKTELAGYNSDIAGIRVSLQSFLDGREKKAIILGTGGSSKAVAYILRKEGLSVSIVSRSPKPGTISYSEVNSGLIENADIIVNTTPLGMFPDIDSMPDIRYDHLSSSQILFDLVYNPEQTRFLRMGAERGCTTISGIKMLYAQAERAWEIWNSENL